MDKLKQMQNDPAERKKAQKQMFFPDVIQLALCIAMVIVGAQVGKMDLFNYKVYKYAK